MFLDELQEPYFIGLSCVFLAETYVISLEKNVGVGLSLLDDGCDRLNIYLDHGV